MDEDRLLKEVVARPEDDAPRLAYAKWLGEQGDPRGELIALSCEVARNPNKTKERRLKKLHDSLWPAWRAELRGFVSGAYYSIRRGFIERAECIDGRSYAPAAEALQRRAPMLRSFLVTYATNLVVDTAPMLHEIEVPSFVALDDFKAIATGKGARDLCKLVLVKASPNTAAMLALAELPQAIETLDLGFDGRLVDFDRVAVAERLAARTHLRELQLKQVKNLDRASRALAGIPSLEKLLLQNADMKSDGLLALTEGLKSLQVLDVSENYIESYASDLDAGKLLDLASPKLRELRLNKLGLSDAQAIAIAASPRATALTHLDLARNDIGDEGALALAQSKHLRNLASLNLNANAISSSTTELLRQSPNFTNTTLQLRSQRSHQRKPQVGSARVAHSAPTATTAPILGPTTAEEIASLAPTMSAPKRFEPSRTPAEPAEILIQAGIEPDRIAQDRFWFLQACQEGPTELMAAFLAHGAAVHAPEDREPPIIKAAEGGSLERIDLLLAHGASPDARDVSGDTALQTAANWKKDDLVRALAARGAALDNMNKLGFTPLLAAIQHKRQSMVELLLSLGANPNAGSERGTAPLLFARESPEAVKALLAAGANPNLTLPPFGDTLLALCAAQGAPEVVSALLEAGANDTPNQCGFTAWMRAHWEGHSEVATALKDVGSKMVKLPQRALHRAVEEGSVAAVRACLKKRAPIDGVDSYGRTPFMRALANGHLEIGEVLAEAGADLAVVAPDAVSALTYAAAGGHVSWVSRLLEQGLSANESQAGSNALLAAARAGALEVVQMLLDAGAAVDSRDEYGQTPLFLAASRDHAPLVELLIARRADVNHPNASGKSSPLDIAVSKGQVNAVRLLLAAGAD
ncbi:MAG TPA: ankyrin repeat domain-containing protein, partial [Polyangiaceae bacterium]|nr:ankyrin repeat domain-containing protein [Polyangiaceae bacterium]